MRATMRVQRTNGATSVARRAAAGAPRAPRAKRFQVRARRSAGTCSRSSRWPHLLDLGSRRCTGPRASRCAAARFATAHRTLRAAPLRRPTAAAPPPHPVSQPAPDPQALPEAVSALADVAAGGPDVLSATAALAAGIAGIVAFNEKKRVRGVLCYTHPVLTPQPVSGTELTACSCTAVCNWCFGLAKHTVSLKALLVATQVDSLTSDLAALKSGTPAAAAAGAAGGAATGVEDLSALKAQLAAAQAAAKEAATARAAAVKDKVRRWELCSGLGRAGDAQLSGLVTCCDSVVQQLP